MSKKLSWISCFFYPYTFLEEWCKLYRLQTIHVFKKRIFFYFSSLNTAIYTHCMPNFFFTQSFFSITGVHFGHPYSPFWFTNAQLAWAVNIPAPLCLRLWRTLLIYFWRVPFRYFSTNTASRSHRNQNRNYLQADMTLPWKNKKRQNKTMTLKMG